mmetsp:Transcript_43438/g.137299  ORF Transcript_43438/g.137299 Transcript_43438/m.137299 type:complete len:105 (-) Transcript_43438:618-932(-)
MRRRCLDVVGWRCLVVTDLSLHRRFHRHALESIHSLARVWQSRVNDATRKHDFVQGLQRHFRYYPAFVVMPWSKRRQTQRGQELMYRQGGDSGGVRISGESILL